MKMGYQEFLQNFPMSGLYDYHEYIHGTGMWQLRESNEIAIIDYGGTLRSMNIQYVECCRINKKLLLLC